MWRYFVTSVAVLLAVATATRYCRKWRAQASFARAYHCQPPRWYPHKFFFFRLELFFEIVRDIITRRFTEGVRERFSLYGQTFTAHLAYRRIICTIDPNNLESIMRNRFDDYTIIKDRQKLIRLVFGEGVFSTTGNNWKHSRDMIRGAMTGADISLEMLDRHARTSIKRFKRSAGERIDMAPEILDYTISVSSQVIFGEDLTAAKEKFKDDFGVYVDMAIRMTLWVDPIPFVGQFFFGRKFNQTKKAVYGYVDRTIEKSARSTTSKGSDTEPLITGMARYEANPSRVRGEALNVLFAGRDTVATGIIELFYMLARHPEVWQRLREEVVAVRLSSVSDLRRLTYLRHVINEGLRLRPALAVHAKKALRDTVLPHGGGDGTEPLFVPKGAHVLYCNYALHRNKLVFGEDVDRFRPSRWETISPQRYEYLNFGAGPRHCPGKDMGWAMVALFTLRMAQTFENLGPADNEPWEEAWSFTFGNKNGLYVRPV